MRQQSQRTKTQTLFVVTQIQHIRYWETIHTHRNRQVCIFSIYNGFLVYNKKRQKEVYYFPLIPYIKYIEFV